MRKWVVRMSITILVFSFLWNYDKCTKECHHKRIIKRLDFDGIVDSTFVDRKNHSYQTIVLNNQSRDEIIPDSEISGFFKLIRPGDHITKKQGTDTVSIKRDSDTIVHRLYIECK